MSLTRLCRAPAALALALAALAVSGTGGLHAAASAVGASPASAAAWADTPGADQPAVTVGADAPVDGRADRWRQGGLLGLWAIAVAVPLFGGRTAWQRQARGWRAARRWSAFAGRAPPAGVVSTRALVPN